jgi:hypothetical protein
MAEKRDRRPRNEDPSDLIDDEVRDISEDNDAEVEDVEEIDAEDEDLDDDLVDTEASGEERHFTSEIGSEGGSAGDLERPQRPGIARGSEATETRRR